MNLKEYILLWTSIRWLRVAENSLHCSPTQMTLRGCWRDHPESENGRIRTTNETEESRLKKKRNVIENATKAELLTALLSGTIVEIELLADLSFNIDFIYILRDADIDLNHFTTGIKELKGSRAIQESVVRRDKQKWARVQVVISSFLKFIEYM